MNLVLIFIVVVTLGAAAVAMSLCNLIHSILLLVGCWAGIAAFYLWAGAEFVAFGQVLVYIGAVSMVVLFAVLLTRRSRTDVAVDVDSFGRAWSALVAGSGVLGVLSYAVLLTDFSPTAPPAPTVSVLQLGTQLMGSQAAALLVVSVILTVALIGGVVIAATDRSENKEDAP